MLFSEPLQSNFQAASVLHQSLPFFPEYERDIVKASTRHELYNFKSEDLCSYCAL